MAGCSAATTGAVRPRRASEPFTRPRPPFGSPRGPTLPVSARIAWCRRDLSDGSPVCFSSQTSLLRSPADTVSEQNVCLVWSRPRPDRRAQLSERVVPKLAERAGSDRLAALGRENEPVRVEFHRAYLAQGRTEHRV